MSTVENNKILWTLKQDRIKIHNKSINMRWELMK